MSQTDFLDISLANFSFANYCFSPKIRLHYTDYEVSKADFMKKILSHYEYVIDSLFEKM